MEILIINFSLDGHDRVRVPEPLRRRRAGVRGGAGPRVQGLAGGSGERRVRRRLYVRERRGGGRLPGLGPVGAGGARLRAWSTSRSAASRCCRSRRRSRAVWQPRPRSPRMASMDCRSTGSSVVGRDFELSVLLRVLEEHGPRVCFVYGIAGIGKSSLLARFGEECERLGIDVVRSTAGRSSRPSRGSWTVWPRPSTRRRPSPRQPTSPRSRAGRPRW